MMDSKRSRKSVERVKKSSRAMAQLISGGLFSSSEILTGTQFDSSNGRQTLTVLVKENWPPDSVHVY